MRFRQLFSLTKHVSHYFILIKAKKFFIPFFPSKNQFFLKNYSGVPPRCNLIEKIAVQKCPKSVRPRGTLFAFQS